MFCVSVFFTPIQRNATVRLTLNLGLCYWTISTTKPLKADDWSQILVMREGPNLELAVRTESRPGEIETESVSDPIPDYCLDFVFHLSIYHSSIYIGGLPNNIAGYFEWIEEPERDMTGQIDGLRIGGEEVSLWNFKTASLIQPSVEPRNKFLPRMAPTLRVDGAIVDGYGHRSFIKLNPEDFSLENEMENIIEFEIWTNSSNGLMFLGFPCPLLERQ